VKTVLVDASSAILLHKAEVLIHIQTVFRLCMTTSVYEELTHQERPGARAVVRAHRDQQITVLTPCGTTDPRHLPSNLHRGERDTLQCYLDGAADFIIIDDGRGAGYCRREAIPYINALLCPRLLVAAGRMTSAAARFAMARIADLGRYSEWVKHHAVTCSDSALTTFLP
jgi:predicted nucleic acid-binding protein